MAVSGSGTKPMGATIDPAMQDHVTSSPINPRSGAAKKAQTDFPTKWGHRDMNVESGNTAGLAPGGKIGPNDATGALAGAPDASSPNPLDPEPRGKTLRRQPGAEIKTPWGMTDANGKGVDPNAAGKVLGEAILSGSTKLPASTSEASGPAPAYSGRDPN
jgi:hypothetical protein